MEFDALVYWHWLAAGLVLLILETLIPANLVLLWMGLSALVVGLVSYAFGTSWQMELVLFGLLSIISFFTYHRFRKSPVASDAPTLNRRGESYVGRSFTLTEPIVNGFGTLKVDDSRWRIAGDEDLPAGTQVKVVRAEGATLRVERAG